MWRLCGKFITILYKRMGFFVVIVIVVVVGGVDFKSTF